MNVVGDALWGCGGVDCGEDRWGVLELFKRDIGLSMPLCHRLHHLSRSALFFIPPVTLPSIRLSPLLMFLFYMPPLRLLIPVSFICSKNITNSSPLSLLLKSLNRLWFYLSTSGIIKGKYAFLILWGWKFIVMKYFFCQYRTWFIFLSVIAILSDLTFMTVFINVLLVLMLILRGLFVVDQTLDVFFCVMLRMSAHVSVKLKRKALLVGCIVKVFTVRGLFHLYRRVGIGRTIDGFLHKKKLMKN